LISTLDAHPAMIVGFSLGGMIAQQIAITAPELVGGLILVSTTCRAPVVGTAHMKQRLEAMEKSGPVVAARLAGQSVFSDGWRAAHPKLFDEFVAWRASQDQIALREVMRAVVTFDASDELSKVKVPTLVVTALGDALMSPDAQSLIFDYLPHAKHAEVAETGHMVSIEKPAEFDAILDGFLAEVWRP
jgi:3-oxoadipate enol-lactonase